MGKIEKNTIILRITATALFIMVCISYFVPWFSVNPNVMGYVFGIIIFPELIIIGMIYLAVFMLAGLYDKIALIVAEICSIMLIVLSVISLGYWPRAWMISDDFGWKLNYTAPTYWISIGVQVAFFIVLQFVIKHRNNVTKDKNNE